MSYVYQSTLHHAVAELAVALMFTLDRKFYKVYNRIRNNNFSIHGLIRSDMYRKTTVVIGTGNIGRTIIQILKIFGMRIVAYEPVPKEPLSKEMGFQ
ncbi:MAG: hypothetical protein N3A63_01305 [Bacteroidetes bacterium]|nr:hypothetical protein [Bacteroidota bacterium]